MQQQNTKGDASSQARFTVGLGFLKASLRSLRGSLPTSDWYGTGQDEGGNSILSIPATSLYLPRVGIFSD